jgi:hypothetical protein
VRAAHGSCCCILCVVKRSCVCCNPSLHSPLLLLLLCMLLLCMLLLWFRLQVAHHSQCG